MHISVESELLVCNYNTHKKVSSVRQTINAYSKKIPHLPQRTVSRNVAGGRGGGGGTIALEIRAGRGC